MGLGQMNPFFEKSREVCFVYKIFMLKCWLISEEKISKEKKITLVLLS